MAYSTVSFQMTFSDLAKYSMTRSIMRSLYDSRASCSMVHCLWQRCTIQSIMACWST